MAVMESSSQSQSVFNRKHHPTTTLPTEIIVEVLLRLPVESLLRSKSACKLWFTLISEPQFVKSHLKLSAQNNSRLIYSLGYGSILNTCFLNDVMNDNLVTNALEVDYPLKSVTQSVRVVGSCNGLLCICVQNDGDDGDDILFIWNPSTRRYHKLPSDGYRTNVSLVHFGFGYEDSTDDYKVVAVFFKLNHVHDFDTFVTIYSLRNGGIGAFPHSKRFDLFAKFMNGCLHWTAYDGDRWAIVSLDLASETFGEVMQPVYGEGVKELLMGTLGEWLCVSCDYHEGRVDLWAMKVYGVKDSWSKLVSVPYTPDPEIDRFLAPLCISNDGKILLTFGTKMMIYDSKKNTFLDIQNFDEDVEASTFFESLVSPMPPAGALEHRIAGSNG